MISERIVRKDFVGVSVFCFIPNVNDPVMKFKPNQHKRTHDVTSMRHDNNTSLENSKHMKRPCSDRQDKLEARILHVHRETPVRSLSENLKLGGRY